MKNGNLLILRKSHAYNTFCSFEILLSNESSSPRWYYLNRERGGQLVKSSDSRSKGCWFDTSLAHYVVSLAKMPYLNCLSPPTEVKLFPHLYTSSIAGTNQHLNETMVYHWWQEQRRFCWYLHYYNQFINKTRNAVLKLKNLMVK